MYTVNVQRLQQLPCLRLLLPHRLHRLSHHNRSQNTRILGTKAGPTAMHLKMDFAPLAESELSAQR